MKKIPDTLQQKSTSLSLPILAFFAASILSGLNLFFSAFMFSEALDQIFIYANFLGLITFFLYLRTLPFSGNRKLYSLALLFCGWVYLLKFLNSGLFTPIIPHEKRFYGYTFLFDFLIFLPFAGIDPDRSKLTGIKILGFFDIIGTMVMVLSAFLLCFDLCPLFLQPFVFWGEEDLRLYVFRNPNLSAGIFMNAIFFCLVFFYTTKNCFIKALNVFLMISISLVLAMTDTTTVFIMLNVMLGGVISFTLVKNRLQNKPKTRWFVLISTGLFFFVILILLFHVVYSILQSQIIAPSVGVDTDYVQRIERHRYSLSRYVTFTGRSSLWIAYLKDAIKDPKVWLIGISDLMGYINSISISLLNRELNHATNYLIESFLGMGLVGLLLCVYASYLAIKNSFILIFIRKTPIIQKIVSMYICCVLVTQFFESFLFCVRYTRNYINVVFLLCMGYQFYWVREPEKDDPSCI